jgi:hypothetical protein
MSKTALSSRLGFRGASLIEGAWHHHFVGASGANPSAHSLGNVSVATQRFKAHAADSAAAESRPQKIDVFERELHLPAGLDARLPENGC